MTPAIPRPVSSKSTPVGAGAAQTLRLIAVGVVVLYAIFSQLDAVGNQLSAGLPISTGEMLFGALLLCSSALLLAEPVRPANLDTPLLPRGVKLILLLACWIVFSWTMSQHRDEGTDYLMKLLASILPALCAMFTLNRVAFLRWVVQAIVAAGAVSAVIVLIESRTGTRLVATSLAATTASYEDAARSSGGSDMNPTTAAQMLMVSTAMALALVMAGYRPFRLALIGIAALGIVALALMSARSAIVGLAAAGALIAWRHRGHTLFPLFLAAGLVAGLVGLYFAPPTLIERFTAIGDFAKDQTLYRRITYLRIGFDLVSQHPVWGVGPGNFPQYYVTDDYRFMPGRFPEPRELHNSFLDTAAEYGLVGLALFGMIIAAAFGAVGGAARALDAELRPVAFAITAGLAALLVASFFMPHKDLRYLWLMIALALQCGVLAGRSTGAIRP